MILDCLEQFGPGADALSYSSAVCACQGHGTAVAAALLGRLELAWPKWLKKGAPQGDHGMFRPSMSIWWLKVNFWLKN